MPAGCRQVSESAKGAGRVRMRVRAYEGCRQSADEGRSPRRVSVECCKHYGVSPDESRSSGSPHLAGIHERPLGEKRPNVDVPTESGRDKCTGW